MKIRHSTGGAPDKVEQQMTPMIDIVFQLLTFFIMSFKIATVEGDFSVKMPLAAPSKGIPDPDQQPPIRVRLTAGQDGQLSGIRMVGVGGGDRVLKSFGELRSEIINEVGGSGGPGSRAQDREVELDCDYDLRYEYVISAITSISGYIGPDQRIIKLIEKIKFAPPHKPAGG